MPRINIRRREKQETKDQNEKSEKGPDARTPTHVEGIEEEVKREILGLVGTGTRSKGKAANAKKTSLLTLTGPGAGAQFQFNPISQYEERVVVPGLTLFDIKRKPRTIPVPTSTSKTATTETKTTMTEKKKKAQAKQVLCSQPLNSLNTLFQCPVCRGYMKNTYIVMECLHRFCGACIQKCLRVGKKECPSCRVHIPSRRSLRPDKNYDSLIEKIFGDVEYLETMENKSIETWNRKNNMNNAYTARREIDISFQAKLRKMKGKPSEMDANGNVIGNGNGTDPGDVTLPVNSDGNDANADNNNNDGIGGTSTSAQAAVASTATLSHQHSNHIENLQESRLVNFILRRHPSEKRMARLHRECIRTSEQITVGHLKRFLGKKLLFGEQNHRQQISRIQILATAGGRFVVMDDDIKLRELRNEIVDQREGCMLKLHYRFQSRPPPPPLMKDDYMHLIQDDDGAECPRCPEERMNE